MNILLVSGHQNALFLIKSLKANQHEVTIVNSDREFSQALADAYEVPAICGNGTNADILKQAHAEKMDIVIALDDQDAANLVICELAKNQFHVKLTFAIVNNPKNVELFQGLGIDKCVNTTSILSELVEQQAIEKNIKKYVPMENGRIVICEVLLTEKSAALNKKLWEIGFPSQSTISCILREEEIIIPQGNTVLKAGDKVVILSSAQVMEKTVSMLTGKR